MSNSKEQFKDPLSDPESQIESQTFSKTQREIGGYSPFVNMLNN